MKSTRDKFTVFAGTCKGTHGRAAKKGGVLYFRSREKTASSGQPFETGYGAWVKYGPAGTYLPVGRGLHIGMVNSIKGADLAASRAP
jgi:hypothetical protein